MWVAFQGSYAIRVDIENGAVGENALLDRAIVDHIARGRLDKAWPEPEAVGHAVVPGALDQAGAGIPTRASGSRARDRFVSRRRPEAFGDRGRDTKRVATVERQLYHEVASAGRTDGALQAKKDPAAAERKGNRAFAARVD
jgi:hypothetical protein